MSDEPKTSATVPDHKADPESLHTGVAFIEEPTGELDTKPIIFDQTPMGWTDLGVTYNTQSCPINK